MATPGPRHRNWHNDHSDTEGELNEEEQEVLPELVFESGGADSSGEDLGSDYDGGVDAGPGAGSESEHLEEEIVPARRGRGRGRARGGTRGGTRGRARSGGHRSGSRGGTSWADADDAAPQGPAAAVQGTRHKSAGKWAGWNLDAEGYAWAGEDVLGKSRTPDALFFFSVNTETGMHKCLLCPCVILFSLFIL